MHYNKPERDAILSRYFPQFTPAADQTTSGLSGGSIIIERGQQRLVLRFRHAATPAAPFLRQYHVLKRLPVSLAPQPLRYGEGWMAVDFLRGEVKTALPATDALAEVLYHLHQQPCFGWRITLLPLLEGYWQQAAPARRTPFWLRQLKRLRKQREPRVLRLAPLHMDVHAGNLVHSAQGLRLIDWEYAGDGDIALELASVWMDDAARQGLVEDYARRASIDPIMLQRQVRRWRPWVMMLMAGWYEYRWQQTGEQQFITLADEIWRQLQTKG
ncbi:thiamine kinase [Enterobacter sp.]|uniref:thiamine kinase n=1 Tax=Enterobacter sp. TaxID=42895 RepID=UPI0029700B60|nr:thiamine kinase [Enterobacter sp.]